MMTSTIGVLSVILKRILVPSYELSEFEVAGLGSLFLGDGSQLLLYLFFYKVNLCFEVIGHCKFAEFPQFLGISC